MIVAMMLIISIMPIAIYSIILILRSNVFGLPLFFISILICFFIIFPNKSGVVANLLGVGRGADLLLYLSFMSGIILILLVHLKFKNQSIMITELARSIALKDADLKGDCSGL
jgi:hypothetical protein